MALNVAPNTPATAVQYNALVPLFVSKAVSTARASTTTVTDDPELFLVLPVGVWHCELVAGSPATGAIAADIKTAWAFTGTKSDLGLRIVTGLGVSSTSASDGTNMRSSIHGTTTEIATAIMASGNSSGFTESFVIDVTVSGTLSLQWAQNVSNVTATTLSATSYIIARRLA